MAPDPVAADDEALFVPVVTGGALPDPRLLPSSPVTRFAPAPTGQLHLGHLVNVLYVWGIARATGGRVILRIEDHDRQRSRPEHEWSMLEDLERLGSRADEPPSAAFNGDTPYRQSTRALLRGGGRRLRAHGLVYACDCSRSTFAVRGPDRGRPWRGIGCPGDCRDRRSPRSRVGLRVAIGDGIGALGGPARGPVFGDGAAPTATCSSATATATGPTHCASSSTTCGTAWTSWSAAAT